MPSPRQGADGTVKKISLITGYDAHRGNLTELLKNVTMAGGFFMLVMAGAGAIGLFGGTPPGLLAWLP